MAGESRVLSAVMYFFFGVILTITSYWIAPAIIELMPTATLEVVCWLGLVVLWIVLLVVLPAWQIIEGAEPSVQ